MIFDIAHEGRTTLAIDYAGALDLGYPAALAGAALKGAAKHQVAEFADAYRAKLATRSAGKLAEYRIKEEIARSPDTASQAELDLLSREAKARGTNRTGLIGQINTQAAAGQVEAVTLNGQRFDCGSVKGFLQAIMHVAQRDGLV